MELPVGVIVARRPEGHFVAFGRQLLHREPIELAEHAVWYGCQFAEIDLSRLEDPEVKEQVQRTAQQAWGVLLEAKRRGVQPEDVLVERMLPGGIELRQHPHGWTVHHADGQWRLHPEGYFPDRMAAVEFAQRVSALGLDLTLTAAQIRQLPNVLGAAWRNRAVQVWGEVRRELPLGQVEAGPAL